MTGELLSLDPPLAVDPTCGVPLNRQLYESMRGAILNGVLRPGDRLPATRALAVQLSLSRSTIAEAYDQLKAEGYVEGRHGSGTYVASNLPPEALRATVRPGFQESGVELSRWGRRIVAAEYNPLFRSAEPSPFVYDFRPHRVAQDSFPWEAWRASVENALNTDRTRLLSYPPSAGHPELIEAVADHLAKHRAVTCSPQQIVIVNGSQQGLNLLSELALDAGDRVAVEDPGYPSARLAFEARQLQIHRVPVDEDGMIVTVLAEAGVHRLVHVTPSHQDPTGATLSLGRRLALLDVAERTGCLVLEDDYDSEFRYEGKPIESLQGLDRRGLVVYAGSFSKSVLPGLRIGFVVLPRPLVAPFVAAKSLWDSGTAMLEQAALAGFMRSGHFERHIRKMRRLYRERRGALVSALSEVFGERVTVGKRHGGLNMLVTLHLSLSDVALAELAAQAGIGLRPASPYYSRRPPDPTFLMGFASLPPPAIREGIAQLAQVVAEQLARG